jgi:hypothetical protein
VLSPCFVVIDARRRFCVTFPFSLDHLLKDERVLQEALYIRGTEQLFFDSFPHRSAENCLLARFPNPAKDLQRG